MVSQQAGRLLAGASALAGAHFTAEADPYRPSANPDGYVNLGTAENRLMWDMLAPRLRAPRPLTEADVRYGPLFGTTALRTAVAGFLARRLAVPVSADDLLILAGATAALDAIASILCDPGEAIAVPVPYYGALDADLTGRSHATLLPVGPDEGGDPAGARLPSAAATAGAIERVRAAGHPVRALVLTSPHNPLGRVYRAAELHEIAGVCADLDLDLVADEVYANCAFDGPTYTSVLHLPARVIDPDRVHMIWGFAKDFALPGFKVGVLHTRHPEVRAAARELAWFAPVSTDTQAVLCQLLSDRAWLDGFGAASRARLADSYTRTAGLLVAAGIPYLPAEAGFSIWMDLRRWLGGDSFDAERALWRRLFDDGRVSVPPGEVFHSAQPGWFRLCHTVDATTVREGIDRIGRVLACA